MRAEENKKKGIFFSQHRPMVMLDCTHTAVRWHDEMCRIEPRALKFENEVYEVSEKKNIKKNILMNLICTPTFFLMLRE